MSAAAVPAARVLVVDDDPSIRDMLHRRLGGRGYDVALASDGAQALASVRSRPPALVILDVMMPGMSGWEVARALKHDDATRDIPILMLTAIGRSMNAITSPLYGADAFLDKPFDMTELEATIVRLVGG